jgi:nitronate monooxygenase
MSDHPTTPQTAPAQLHDVPVASSMSRVEYGALLNVLLESERAGARLLREYLEELPPDSEARAWLRSIQNAEAHNCLVLLELLRDAEIQPSRATGDFYRKGLAIRGWPERLEFLNRGQVWVARRIAEALPRISTQIGKGALQAMCDSHWINIGICEHPKWIPE